MSEMIVLATPLTLMAKSWACLVTISVREEASTVATGGFVFLLLVLTLGVVFRHKVHTVVYGLTRLLRLNSTGLCF